MRWRSREGRGWCWSAGNGEAEIRGEAERGEAGNREAKRGEAGNEGAERGGAWDGQAERKEAGTGLLVIESRDQGRGWEWRGREGRG